MKSGTFFIELSGTYDEAVEHVLGGGLDGADEEGNSLNGLFTGDAAPQDQIADDHQSGVGSRQHQSVHNDLAVEKKFKLKLKKN
jgi:hypothetical protein